MNFCRINPLNNKLINPVWLSCNSPESMAPVALTVLLTRLYWLVNVTSTLLKNSLRLILISMPFANCVICMASTPCSPLRVGNGAFFLPSPYFLVGHLFEKFSRPLFVRLDRSVFVSGDILDNRYCAVSNISLSIIGS